MRRPWRNPFDELVIGVVARVEPRLSDRRRVRLARRRHERYERRAGRSVAGDPRHLQHAERSLFSQNGEDGIIDEIFRRIGPGDRWFVEIGAADGEENCTRWLVEQGWQGVWVEGDGARAAHARQVVGARPVVVLHELLEPDGASAALDAAGVPVEPDLLVIDIDGNDAWMWAAVARDRRPRVVVIEVNARVGPRLRWSLPYRPGRAWDETARHGASLPALAALGRRLGYSLVGCDSRGVNAFFVRADLVAGHFGSRPVRELWVPPRFALPYGHPWRPTVPLDLPPADGDTVAALSVRIVDTTPRPCVAQRPVYFEADIANGGRVTVGETVRHPIRLAAWWEDAQGRRLAVSTDERAERVRSIQAWSAPPGATARVLGMVAAPPIDGSAVLAVALVQEGLRWLDDRPGGTDRLPGWTVTTSGCAPADGRAVPSTWPGVAADRSA